MTRAAAFLWCATLAAQDFTVDRDVKVPLRDGVKLAADIYRPTAAGRYPTIVVRTPYNRAGVRGYGEFFAARGYALVAQDVRGRFGSEGAFYAFVNEGKDGYDTIEWAAAQPWSNGKVGTTGASYLAWDQYHAAMYKPPHLEAMFADVGGNNFYREFAYPGGAPNLGWTIWMTSSAASSGIQPADELRTILKDPASWFALPPSERARVFDRFPAQKKLFEDFYAHPDFDDYWKQPGFFTEGGWKRMKDVPTFFISGWYDYFIEGLIENFTALSKIQRTAKRLWIGPWPHSVGRSTCGQMDYGEAARADVRELAAAWFDHHLKGLPLEQLGRDRVRLFRMGSNEWLGTSDWPPKEAARATLYLDGAKLSAAKAAPGQREWRHDPKVPIPSIGGRYTMVPGIPPCAQDQSTLDTRADIVRFSTPERTTPLDITGMVRARLFVRSTATTADFTAKLVDVAHNGQAIILLDGIRRAALTPGRKTEVEVELGSLSALIQPGHRLRLDVASSNFPRAEVNPEPATNTVLWGTESPSRLEFLSRTR